MLPPCGKSFPFGKFPFGVYPFLGLPSNLHFPSTAEMFFGKLFCVHCPSLLSRNIIQSVMTKIFNSLKFCFRAKVWFEDQISWAALCS